MYPNTHGLHKGDVIVINTPHGPLDGVKAKFIKQSQRTSECTVELTEARGVFKRGDRVTVKQWEMS